MSMPPARTSQGPTRSFRTLRAHSFDLALGGLLDSDRQALKPSIVQNIEEGRRLTVADLHTATATRSRLYLGMLDFFSRYDLLLAPVSQVTPFDAELEYPREVAGRPTHTYLDWMRSAYLISVLGVPALSVPRDSRRAACPWDCSSSGPRARISPSSRPAMPTRARHGTGGVARTCPRRDPRVLAPVPATLPGLRDAPGGDRAGNRRGTSRLRPGLRIRFQEEAALLSDASSILQLCSYWN